MMFSGHHKFVPHFIISSAFNCDDDDGGSISGAESGVVPQSLSSLEQNAIWKGYSVDVSGSFKCQCK